MGRAKQAQQRENEIRPPTKPDSLGVSGMIHCKADPLRFILPLLHLLIGLLNKALETLREWLDVKVELIGESEMNLRKECIAAVEEYTAVRERLNQIKTEKADEYQKRNRLYTELLSGQRTPEMEQELVRLDDRIEELKREYEELEDERPLLRLKESDLKKRVKEATKARIGNKDGLDTKINEIMRRRALIVPQTR